MSIKTASEIRRQRRRTPRPITDTLVVACLWPKTGANLGTTLRTCDAVGAKLVAPKSADKATRRGNTIGLHNSPVELIDDPESWLSQKVETHRVVGVELAHNAIPISELAKAHGPTVAVVGHETSGIPPVALDMCHEVVEIPMEGVGNSLNVSVATALVLYKLKGWI